MIAKGYNFSPKYLLTIITGKTAIVNIIIFISVLLLMDCRKCVLSILNIGRDNKKKYFSISGIFNLPNLFFSSITFFYLPA